jgi:hypothetical protein
MSKDRSDAEPVTWPLIACSGQDRGQAPTWTKAHGSYSA